MNFDFDSIKSYVNTPQFAQNAQAFGMVSSVAGMIGDAFNAYYAAESQKLQYEQQKLNWDWKKFSAELNMRQSERQLAIIDMQWQQQRGQVGQKIKAAKGAVKTSAAARGIDIASASVQQIADSYDLIKEEEYYAIDTNGMTKMFNQRMTILGYQLEATKAGIGMGASAASGAMVSPYLAMGSSLLTNASKVAAQWAPNKFTAGQTTLTSPPMVGGGGGLP